MKLSLDADLKNEKMDTISATTFADNGNKINITNINLLSPTSKRALSLSPLGENMDSDVRSAMAGAINYTGKSKIAYSPIYKYQVDYDSDNALFNFTLANGGNDSSDFNPAVLSNNVSAQLGAQTVQLNSYTEAFRNMDMFMLLPQADRLAYKYKNKYAAGIDNILEYDNHIDTYQREGGWFRPYTTFENVPLKHGPKVHNTAYGSYFGYDSSLMELSHGWDGAWGIYAGYNGSHQSYRQGI